MAPLWVLTVLGLSYIIEPGLSGIDLYGGFSIALYITGGRKLKVIAGS
jgi:hypothetical protein